ncbi:MAG TPA: hypothetical protein VL991_09510 [Terracidiphilus sp.]|nr:hypothetical protein [Terracidiphilus sp.]
MQSEQSIPAIGVSIFDICGWLSVACCLPYLALLAGGKLADFLGGLWMVLLLACLLCPLAGAVLALIASFSRRWWLLLAASWIAWFAFLAGICTNIRPLSSASRKQ